MKTEYRNLIRDEKTRFRKNAGKLTAAQRRLAESHVLDAVVAVKSSAEIKAGLIDFDDAIAEGYLILAKCAKAYENRGFEFATYLSSSIKWRMKEIVRKESQSIKPGLYEIPEISMEELGFQEIEIANLIAQIEENLPSPADISVLGRLMEGGTLMDIKRESPEVKYDELRRYKKKIADYLRENEREFVCKK